MAPIGEEVPHQNLGAEVFLEWNAAPSWLALEFSAGGVAVQDGAQIIINLIFKKSFHLNARLEPYIGLGPIFLPTVAEGLTSFDYGVGGAAVTGTHVWLTSGMGLVAELKYNLLHQSRDEHAGLAQEFGVGAGFVLAR